VVWCGWQGQEVCRPGGSLVTGDLKELNSLVMGLTEQTVCPYHIDEDFCGPEFVPSPGEGLVMHSKSLVILPCE
jgi:hypothetical protein